MDHRRLILASACALAVAGCGGGHHSGTSATHPAGAPRHASRCPAPAVLDHLVRGGKPWRSGDPGALALRQAPYAYACRYAGTNVAQLALVYGVAQHPRRAYPALTKAWTRRFQRAYGIGGPLVRHRGSFAITAEGAREVVAAAVKGRNLCLVPDHFGGAVVGPGDIDGVEAFVRRACDLPPR